MNSVFLINTGTVSELTGTLLLNGGGIETGNFSVASGTTMQFGNGHWEFNNGSSVQGSGTVQFGSNAWPCDFNSGSTYNVTGQTKVSGTIVKFASGSRLFNTGALSVTNNGVWNV
jgi:hypothetical protein